MIHDGYGNRRFYGIYRGVVVENQDPLGEFRLKLKIPQVLHDQVTDWAWSIHQPGVARSIPEIGTGVWVSFEGGDPSYPLWNGTFSVANTGSFPAGSLNYGSFQATYTQIISAITPTALSLDQIDESNNIRISSATRYLLDLQTITTGTQYITSTGLTKLIISPSSGILPGDTVYIAGVTPTTYNGTWIAQPGTSGTTLYIKTGSNLGSVTNSGLVSLGTKFYIDVVGTYNLQFSIQLQNTDNVSHDVYIWLTKNNTALAGSTGIVPVPARKSASIFGKAIASWNYVFTTVAGEYFQLLAEAESDSTTGISAKAVLAGTLNTHAIGIQTITTGTHFITATGLTKLTIATATFYVGQTIYISGVSPSEYNGAWVAQTGTAGTSLYIKTDANLGSVTNAGTVSEVPDVPSVVVTITQVK